VHLWLDVKADGTRSPGRNSMPTANWPSMVTSNRTHDHLGYGGQERSDPGSNREVRHHLRIPQIERPASSVNA